MAPLPNLINDQKAKLLFAAESVDAVQLIHDLAARLLTANELNDVTSDLALYRSDSGLWGKSFGAK